MEYIRPFTLTSDQEFSRASIAWYWDENGDLQSAAIDEPRFQYHPATGELEGLLREGQARQELTYSNDFTNAAWLKGNLGAIVAGFKTSKGLVGQYVPENTANAEHLLERYPSGLALGQEYTHFWVFEPDLRFRVRVNVYSQPSSGNNFGFRFDASTEQIDQIFTQGTGNLTDYGAKHLGGNMWLLWVTGSFPTETQRITRFQICNAAGQHLYTGDGVSGVILYHSQLNAGGLTSLILTTAAAFTREADIVTDVNLVSNVPENDAPVWTIGGVYGVGDEAVYLDNNKHWLIRSLQAANTGHIPTGLTTDAWWKLVSETNRWKMFDIYTGSQTTNPDAIEVSVQTTGRVDSLALLNVNASKAHIAITDATDGLVYQSTINLVSEAGIDDWYSYFSEPIEYISDLVRTGLPWYTSPIVDVTLINAGGTASCGSLVLGQAKYIGQAELGLRLGITDYSVKSANEFGEYTITERSFSRYMDVNVLMEKAQVDPVFKSLAQFRATPLVYIGTQEYSGTFIFGFYKDFGITIAYPKHSLVNFEIEGLTS